jgi:cyclic dehypoxanthinyl futalosine synthase
MVQMEGYRPTFDVEAVVAGELRLTEAQALELYREADLRQLGAWAHAVTMRRHPEDYRTYIVDRNINYTNVCTSKCTFCGFRRDHDDADSYTLNHQQIGQKIEELIAIGGTQILMQGGMNDRLPMSYYLDLLAFIRDKYPTIHIHAFSPPEFVEFERFWDMDARDIIRRFKAAGLMTIPGGGGEIFPSRVRDKIGHIKASGADWLRIMRLAHEEGMNTSGTMMMGHIETVPERFAHMGVLRDMQAYALALDAKGTEGPGDKGTKATEIGQLVQRVEAVYPGTFTKSPPAGLDPLSLSAYVPPSLPAAGSFEAFIHWPFQRENVPLGRAKEYDPAVHGDFDSLEHPDVAKGRVVRMAGSHEYLRTLAIARLFFDNVPSLQSSWVTMGPKIGQLALFFGANDMGGAMMEENVVSAAGTTYDLGVRELCRLIRDAGWVPAQRDQYYHVLRRWDGEDAPDLQPLAEPPVRQVGRLSDKTWIGSAPGLDDVAQPITGPNDGTDRGTKFQLHVLGGDR